MSGRIVLAVLEGGGVHSEDVVVAHVVADLLGRHGALHVGTGDQENQWRNALGGDRKMIEGTFCNR